MSDFNIEKERWLAAKAMNAAIAKAQAEVKNAQFNRTNPHFKSKYADLAEISNTVRKVFSANGIGIVQSVTVDGGITLLDTTLTHTGGASVTNRSPIPGDNNNPIKMMANVTSARRTALCALACIAAEEDPHLEAAEAESKLIGDSLLVVLEEKIEATGANKDRFLKAYGIEDLSHLPMDKFADAMNKLEQKVKAVESQDENS